MIRLHVLIAIEGQQRGVLIDLPKVNLLVGISRDHDAIGGDTQIGTLDQGVLLKLKGSDLDLDSLLFGHARWEGGVNNLNF